MTDQWITDSDHHVTEARNWADAADREMLRSDEPDNPDRVRQGKRAERYTAISQAHALAAIATTLTKGLVAVTGDMNVRQV